MAEPVAKKESPSTASGPVSESSTAKTELRVLERVAPLEPPASELAAVLEAAPVALLSFDMSGKIIHWNRFATALFGWTTAEAVGKNAFELVFKSGGLRLSEIIRSLSELEEREYELRETARAGHALSLLCRMSVVKDSSGDPLRILLTARDVTEKKEIETRRLRAERLQSIGTLAGGIAHDVNNALLPIMFAAEMMKEDLAGGKGAEYAEQVMRNAERVQRIMRQILLFVGSIRPGRHRIDMTRLLMDTEQMLGHTLPKTLQVQLSAAPGLHPILGEETQIAQVLMNLCLNARDAMAETGTLTLSAENTVVDATLASQYPDAKPGPHVLITVADTGSGIPDEILDKIFDPFFTTKAANKATGLGLSTALGIVKSHGGFLSVSSRQNHGTKFQIWLPATAQQEPGKVESTFQTPRGQGQCVLIIDDEEGVRRIAKDALENAGYRALTAADGTEGLALFAQQKEKIQAILCDMMMPVMDGAVTIKALKRIDADVPILAMSGLIEDRATGAKAAGAGVLLQKPFSAETLLKTIALFVK